MQGTSPNRQWIQALQPRQLVTTSNAHGYSIQNSRKPRHAGLDTKLATESILKFPDRGTRAVQIFFRANHGVLHVLQVAFYIVNTHEQEPNHVGKLSNLLRNLIGY